MNRNIIHIDTVMCLVLIRLLGFKNSDREGLNDSSGQITRKIKIVN